MSEMLSTVRKDYNKHVLTEEGISVNPFDQFQQWMDEAFEVDALHANAMVLSTVDKTSMPHSRVVLLRDVSYGGFTFFTNYNSHKAQDIALNKNASLLFFWPALERQLRIEGSIAQLPEAESDIYFESRPFESKVGAWVSKQSEVLNSRQELEDKFNEELGNYANKQVPRPSHWGGYVLVPHAFEFWQGRPSRLHDRIHYSYNTTTNKWVTKRLMP